MSTIHKEVDFLIVGQGIAGSLLAWILHHKGKRVHIVDNFHKDSSSVVAAGIINPITGRRLVKSWMIDDLLPEAKKLYQEIEDTLTCKLYTDRVIYRALKDIKAENQWDERSINNGYVDYLGSETPKKEVLDILEAPFSWGAVHHAAQVDVLVLLQFIKNYFLSTSQLSQEDLVYDQLEIIESGGVKYKNIISKQVVFCEGQKGRFNPWFKYLPFVVSKGEMLEIELEEKVNLPIIKHRAYLAPLGKNRYWVGATYEWDDLNSEASEKARKQLVENLDKSISVNYKIVTQHAAIRPTVKDRRPFLGTHHLVNCLHIFNGLGTKGTSLGPYWAKHFAGYLLGEHEIAEQVDINRFEKNNNANS